MTKTEKRRVQDALSYATQRKGCLDSSIAVFVSLLGSFLLGGFLVFLSLAAWEWLRGLPQKPGLSPLSHQVLFSMGGLAGSIFAARVLSQHTQETRREVEKERQVYQRDLENGQVEVWHCEVSRAVRLEEEGDEGPGFFLELASGQVLFLQGQYFDAFVNCDYDLDPHLAERPEEQGVWPPPPHTVSSPNHLDFPCRQFDLIYAPNSREVVGLVCLGPPIIGGPIHPPLYFLWGKEQYPNDGEILPVSLDTLDEDLARWAAGQERSKPN